MQIGSQPEVIDSLEEAFARQGMKLRSPDAPRSRELIAKNLCLLTKDSLLYYHQQDLRKGVPRNRISTYIFGSNATIFPRNPDG
jgi:hypothetical protein